MSSSKFNAAYCNMQSIGSDSEKCKRKIAKMKEYIMDRDLDVFAMTETWFKPDGCYEDRAPEGYRLLHRAREGDKRGGGVALIVKGDLKVKEEHGFSEDVKTFEHMTTYVKSADNKSSVLVSIVYRPPDIKELGLTTHKQLELFQTEFASYKAWLQRLTKQRKSSFVIVGDFNFRSGDELKTKTHILEQNSPQLSCLVTDPTHTHGGVLDLVLEAKNANHVKQLVVENTTHPEPGYKDERSLLNSDHLPIKYTYIYTHIHALQEVPSEPGKGKPDTGNPKSETGNNESETGNEDAETGNRNSFSGNRHGSTDYGSIKKGDRRSTKKYTINDGEEEERESLGSRIISSLQKLLCCCQSSDPDYA